MGLIWGFWFMFFYYLPVASILVIIINLILFSQVTEVDTTEVALGILDNYFPKVTVSFTFGDSTMCFESRFPIDQLSAITERVTSVLALSADPDASISINNVTLELGTLHCPSVLHLTNSDPHLAEMIRRNSWSFLEGNSKWEIGMSFLFGDERVYFHSRFDSHLTPTALSVSKCIIALLAPSPSLNPNAQTRYYLQRVEPHMGNWRYTYKNFW
jgi:hypothetical protein